MDIPRASYQRRMEHTHAMTTEERPAYDASSGNSSNVGVEADTFEDASAVPLDQLPVTPLPTSHASEPFHSDAVDHGDEVTSRPVIPADTMEHGTSSGPDPSSPKTETRPQSLQTTAATAEEVNAEETAPDNASETSRSSVPASKSAAGPSAYQLKSPQKLFSKLPSMSWDAGASHPANDNRPPGAAPPSKKLSGPFSWLSRISSKETPATTASTPAPVTPSNGATPKSPNAVPAATTQSLEERTDSFDPEHAQVASELVRTKVENAELREEVENLKGQIDELKAIVENQPREVEARLKEEMDRIMQRNLEVQNENRALEEQMSEMEKDLVHAKMRYAEIDSAHETLKQKWNDLKRALND